MKIQPFMLFFGTICTFILLLLKLYSFVTKLAEQKLVQPFFVIQLLVNNIVWYFILLAIYCIMQTANPLWLALNFLLFIRTFGPHASFLTLARNHKWPTLTIIWTLMPLIFVKIIVSYVIIFYVFFGAILLFAIIIALHVGRMLQRLLYTVL